MAAHQILDAFMVIAYNKLSETKHSGGGCLQNPAESLPSPQTAVMAPEISKHDTKDSHSVLIVPVVF